MHQSALKLPEALQALNRVPSLLSSIGCADGDLVVLIGGSNAVVTQAVGLLRPRCAELMIKHRLLNVSSDELNLCWIVDFPLFEPTGHSAPSASLQSVHHPFTAPVPQQESIVSGARAGDNPSALLEVRAQSYDLVLNGHEIAGGSIRIHTESLQRHVFGLLGADTTVFNHLLDAFRCGAPPHGGIALGLDRFASLLCGASSISDVIAFPKTSSGQDLLSHAPAAVAPSALAEYHLKVDKQ